MHFLKRRSVQILTVALLLHAATFYGFSRPEQVPINKPLNEVPKQFNKWTLSQEGVVEKEVQEVLRADDLLNRSYVNTDLRLPANLFVAYFRTQRTGQAPHSPKNCLPGNGWVTSASDIINIPIAGRTPIEVNRYVVSRGDQSSMVLYWYQSRDRTVASEYNAKFWVVADAVRHNRTDTALVRVIVPIAQGKADLSEKAAIDFVQSFFTPLRQHFPA